MSIPKLKFLALFFVFFAVFWQITTSFYIKMSPAGRQDLPRAAGGVRLSPQKPSAFHASVRSGSLRRAFFGRCRTQQKKHKGLRQNFAWRCTNSRRKIARRSYFALPRCARVKRKQEQFCRLLGKNAASPVRAWAQKLASLPVFVALRRFAVATAHKTEWRSGTTQHPRVGKTV